MKMPGRYGAESEYDYGFNGMRKDDEVHSQDGSSYDFGARMYDARIGRFLSIDPMFGKYPSLSHYSFVANNPIMFIDIEGKYIGDPNDQATKDAKAKLTNTEAGQILWKALENSKREVFFHTASSTGTSDEQNLYKALNTGEGTILGNTAGKATFDKMLKGEVPGAEEIKKDFTFNSSTGDYDVTSNEQHIIINEAKLGKGYSVPQVMEGISPEEYVEDVRTFVLAEEATHALQEKADFTIKVIDDNNPTKYKEVDYLDKNGKPTEFVKPYGERKSEIDAHKNAKQVTGKDPLNLVKDE